MLVSAVRAEQVAQEDVTGIVLIDHVHRRHPASDGNINTNERVHRVSEDDIDVLTAIRWTMSRTFDSYNPHRRDLAKVGLERRRPRDPAAARRRPRP